MELRHMRHFVAVAEERNFSRAARRLNMAQPPLSQSIRRLEDDLGVQLFIRSGRGVELTRSGEVFLREARSALRHGDLAQKLARREGEARPEVRIGFTPSALYRVLPEILVGFRDTASDANVHLFEASSIAQMAALSAGERDVVFVSERTRGLDRCSICLLDRAPIVAAVPNSWDLASRESVTLAELSEHPFILPPGQEYTAGSDGALSMFRKAGVMPYVTQGMTHASTTLKLVGIGLGCTITTASAALSYKSGVTFVPIDEYEGQTEWGLIMAWMPEQLTDASRGFVDFASTYAIN